MRVKRGNVARNRRKKVFKVTKGFRGPLSKLFRPAHQAMLNALSHAFRDRRRKKRDFRRLWIARLSGALRNEGLNYSTFIHQLKVNNVELNRKVLSELAIYEPEAFKTVVQTVATNK